MRDCYDRGDLPVSVDRPGSHPSGGSVIWEVEPQLLDYECYLPMFFGGLVELEEPYGLFASRGVADMLQAGEDEYVAPVVPLLIAQLRTGLTEPDPRVCTRLVLSLQQLIKVGKLSRRQILVQLKKLLPPLRKLLLKTSWSGYSDGGLDADSRSTPDLTRLVEETVQMLHRYGGEKAYKIIKSICPTYSGMV
eukprot:TRINITY_DN3353_c0_g1_i1.p1 TRINITY_DN3353_c0_g1~~TRINITY_DN3353_c0_g1_i1.p1  ORF type:complete len:192 (+),score=16.58 TRINITY_DN3353_c0_g1_i1:711-1286(+)